LSLRGQPAEPPRPVRAPQPGQVMVEPAWRRRHLPRPAPPLGRSRTSTCGVPRDGHDDGVWAPGSRPRRALLKTPRSQPRRSADDRRPARPMMPRPRAARRLRRCPQKRLPLPSSCAGAACGYPEPAWPPRLPEASRRLPAVSPRPAAHWTRPEGRRPAAGRHDRRRTCSTRGGADAAAVAAGIQARRQCRGWSSRPTPRLGSHRALRLPPPARKRPAVWPACGSDAAGALKPPPRPRCRSALPLVAGWPRRTQPRLQAWLAPDAGRHAAHAARRPASAVHQRCLSALCRRRLPARRGRPGATRPVLPRSSPSWTLSRGSTPSAPVSPGAILSR
jgi:hypothetical protein